MIHFIYKENLLSIGNKYKIIFSLYQWKAVIWGNHGILLKKMISYLMGVNNFISDNQFFQITKIAQNHNSLFIKKSNISQKDNHNLQPNYNNWQPNYNKLNYYLPINKEWIKN